MKSETIGAEMTVEELIARYPSAARAFVRRRMHCVGCELARFETVAEVCEVYHQPLGALLAELNLLARAHRRRTIRRDEGGISRRRRCND